MQKASHFTRLLTASLVLTSYALAQRAQDPLVQIVRTATERYQNVAKAAPDYGPALGCVSGPDHGAMGIHYVNGSLLKGETLLADGQLDPTRPQALIYEPQPNGELKLVGVEFIIFASAIPAGPAPQVEDHLMQYIDGQSASRPDGTPNRYGLPAIFELHVWAWRDNPPGRLRGLEQSRELREPVVSGPNCMAVARGLPISSVDSAGPLISVRQAQSATSISWRKNA